MSKNSLGPAGRQARNQSYVLYVNTPSLTRKDIAGSSRRLRGGARPDGRADPAPCAGGRPHPRQRNDGAGPWPRTRRLPAGCGPTCATTSRSADRVEADEQCLAGFHSDSSVSVSFVASGLNRIPTILPSPIVTRRANVAFKTAFHGSFEG